MLPYSEWLDAAKALELGRTKRVKHCNHNTTMIISHDEDGYHAHCFRCSEHGFKGHGIQRIHDVFATKEFCYAKDPELPDDFTLDVPPDSAVWYYKHGVSASTARAYGIGYSRELRRVVIPVYGSEGRLAVVQARAVHEGMVPKYLNQCGNSKARVLFKSHKTEGTCVCITEDILSCIRVGEVMPCVCPMGTSLSDHQAAQIIAQYDTVMIWLDNDAAGHNGSIKMYKKLSMVMQAHIVHADHDPKIYNRQQIKEILS